MSETETTQGRLAAAEQERDAALKAARYEADIAQQALDAMTMMSAELERMRNAHTAEHARISASLRQIAAAARPLVELDDTQVMQIMLSPERLADIVAAADALAGGAKS